MNGEETTTLGAVAESQQNISMNEATQNVAQQAQPVQPEQTTVANDNWTWSSSWDVQTTQTTEAPSADDILAQVNAILEENKTL